MYHFESCVLDPQRRELRHGTTLVQVEPQVLDLLLFLIRNRDRVVSKDELLEAVWHGRIVSESTLFNRINAARSAVGDDGNEQRLIKTLPRKGLRFIGEVREMHAAEALQVSPTEAGSSPATGNLERVTIAVLPFANQSGDASQEYLSDGIAGDIITALSRFSELVVISRNSSFTYKGKAIDIRIIGQQLGARYALEGTVAHGGGRIRVSAQLIDTSTGANLWAERFDRKFEDVFEVQDDVVRMIVAIIAVQLNKAEVERAHIKPPTTWQAYDFYLQGAAAYAAWLSTYLPAQLYAARRCFEQSIALDPSLARAHSQLSRTFLSAWINPVDDDHLRHAALDRAYDLARRAVQLDPNLPQARASLGYVLTYQGQHDEALAQFNRATETNPSFTDWTSILAHVFAGESLRALEIGHALARLDPFSPAVAHGFIGFAHYMLKQYEAALAPLRDCVRRAPNFRGGHFWLAATSAQLGMTENARAEAAEVLRIDPGYTINRSAKPLAMFKKPSDTEHWMDGLRKAGLPE